MLNSRTKNEFKRLSLSGEIAHKRIKHSDWLRKFWGHSFPLWADWGGTPPINQQMTKSSPIRVLPAKFLHPPNKSLAPLFLLEIGH